MQHEITASFAIAKALESLLYPYAEIVLHDLKTRTIAAIFNAFSQRKVGDDSLLEDTFIAQSLPDHFEPYYKTNWDGRRIKSTTATIRNNKGQPIGLFCINLDISHLDTIQQHLALFTQQGLQKALPEALFSEDWREKISIFVHEHLKKNGKTLQILTKEEKKELVRLLHQEGAFRAKHAATYVGHVLGISRATVYKYLAAL